MPLGIKIIFFKEIILMPRQKFIAAFFKRIENVSLKIPISREFIKGNSHHHWKCRGIEAEMLMGFLARSANMNFQLASNGNSGYDCIINGLKVQVKQRTLNPHGFYSISNLHPQLFHTGEVDAFVVFETNPAQQLTQIILSSAEKVFKHPQLYYSKFNQNWQLTNTRFKSVAEKIITLPVAPISVGAFAV